MNYATGTYTGNGTNQVIATLPWNPTILLVQCYDSGGIGGGHTASVDAVLIDVSTAAGSFPSSAVWWGAEGQNPGGWDEGPGTCEAWTYASGPNWVLNIRELTGHKNCLNGEFVFLAIEGGSDAWLDSWTGYQNGPPTEVALLAKAIEAAFTFKFSNDNWPSSPGGWFRLSGGTTSQPMAAEFVSGWSDTISLDDPSAGSISVTDGDPDGWNISGESYLALALASGTHIATGIVTPIDPTVGTYDVNCGISPSVVMIFPWDTDFYQAEIVPGGGVWVTDQNSTDMAFFGGGPYSYIDSFLSDGFRFIPWNIFNGGSSASNCYLTYLVIGTPAGTPSCSSVQVGYGQWTRTGPNNNLWFLSFYAVDGDNPATNFKVYTGAGRTGTEVTSGTTNSTSSTTVSIAYDAPGIVDGSQTLYLSIDDGLGGVGGDCSFTLKRDDVAPLDATITLV